MMNMNEELMAKARQVKSAEELLALAKENNIEFTEERANAYFEKLNQSGELEDDELDSVAGGGCLGPSDRPVSANDSCHIGRFPCRCRDCNYYINIPEGRFCKY